MSWHGEKQLSRRRFLKSLGLSLLAAPLFRPEVPAASDYSEVRTLNRKALILAGEPEGSVGSAIFYLDAVSSYNICVNELKIPRENITVLYANGWAPSPPEIAHEFRVSQAKESALDIATSQKILMPIRGSIRKSEVVSHLTRLAQTPVDQLLIFSTLHGSLDWEYHENKLTEIHSVMRLLDDNSEDNFLTEEEFTKILLENKSREVIAFLAQCKASYFAKIAAHVPNLAIFMSNGRDGVNENTLYNSYVDPVIPWSESVRRGIRNPLVSDIGGDHDVSLADLEGFIMTHDPIAKGVYQVATDSMIEEHPNVAYGSAIEPDKVAILRYK